MKWLRKKNSIISNSAGSSPCLNHSSPSLSFPNNSSSWISRFKQTSNRDKPNNNNHHHHFKLDSPVLHCNGGGVSQYQCSSSFQKLACVAEEDDGRYGFWRLSFGGQDVEQSANYHEFSKVMRSNGCEIGRTPDAASDTTPPPPLPPPAASARQMLKQNNKEKMVLQMRRSPLSNSKQGTVELVHQNPVSPMRQSSNEKQHYEHLSPNYHDGNQTSISEISRGRATLNREKLKSAKLGEIMSKRGLHHHQRKSVYIEGSSHSHSYPHPHPDPDPDRKEMPPLMKQLPPQQHGSLLIRAKASKGGRGRAASSPRSRTPAKGEICKIKALQDMKRAHHHHTTSTKKNNSKIKEPPPVKAAAAARLESCAVVKRSLNPQEDFRYSMLEMIVERRITTPEELEDLLATYLTLNSDEYHDLIIKVFREVWAELDALLSTSNHNTSQ